MRRVFFGFLRSFVRREVIRVLPLALLLRLGYEVTGAGGSRTFPGAWVRPVLGLPFRRGGGDRGVRGEVEGWVRA